ncbi:MAG: lipoyl(octanoyl) transferase LipB [Sphingomonas sp.]|uniref:lipoyl(octanoyl) transferase LipB n=1 Tax=Sphingomonas sp. TaxID=28214 RepID=UPI003F806B39
MIPADIEWRISTEQVPYAESLAAMEARAVAVAAGDARELVWLLEHPPVYTGGTSADAAELIDPRFPVVQTGRGGRYTYHGPGQRVGYLVLDLNRRGRDIRCFIHELENWLIAALGAFGIAARAESGRVGIWTGHGPDEAKIGAIGVRVKRWVTLHGFAINLDPDLSHFGGIVPCGLADYPVTSAAALGKTIVPATFDAALERHFPAFLAALSAHEKRLEQHGISV